MNSNDVDILLPFHGPSDRLLAQLDSIKKHTPIEYRLVVILDACGSAEVAAAKKWLQEHRPEKATILGTTDTMGGFSRALQLGLRSSIKKQREYTAVIHPGIELDDSSWVSKMTTAFKDRSCFISYAELFGESEIKQSSQGSPRIVDRTMHPAEGLILLRRATADDIDGTDLNHPWMHTASKARKDGRRIYAVPSVRLKMVKMVESKAKVLKGYPSTNIMVER